jgi:hypothetical protein
MAIIYAPVYTVNSIYSPCTFVTSRTNAIPVVKAQAEIYVDGSFIVTNLEKSPYSNVGTTYYFEFDISRILQTLNQPKPQNQTSIFGEYGQPYIATNNDIHCFFYAIIKYYEINPITGLITQIIGSDILFPNYAISGAIQPFNENQGFNNYLMYFGSNVPALTNHPYTTIIGNRKPICDDENEFMTILPFDALINAYQVITFDSNGSVLEIGKKVIPDNTTYIPITIGVGVPNLTGVSWDSGTITTFTGVAYYTIEFGNLSISTFTTSSQIYGFEIENCCTNNIRLLWMNRLGGSDAFTFKVKNIYKEVSKGEIGQIPARWDPSFSLGTYLSPIRSFDKGRFKINSVSEKVFQVESEYYLPEIGYWLMEVLSSPEVYMEWHDPMHQYYNFNIESGFVAVIIDDAELTWNSTNDLVNVSFTLRMSNYVNMQQN